MSKTYKVMGDIKAYVETAIREKLANVGGDEA